MLKIGKDMLITKYRKSKWLKKEDVDALSDEQRRTMVESIEEDQVGDDVKPVVFFTGIAKGWPINMTGLEVLAELTGSQDTEDFVGANVELYVDPGVRYSGKRVGGIKLRPTAAKPVAKEDGTPFDDAIAF